MSGVREHLPMRVSCAGCHVQGTSGKAVVRYVDGDAVTSDPWVLAGIKVQAEVVDHHKGVKIDILRYKNKTGYRRRQGHRQQYTAIKVTEIPTAAK